MGTKNFCQIFEEEVEAINMRRLTKERLKIIELEEEDKEHDGTPIMRPRRDADVIGLALSGGGIRSAAFCLGVLQALDARDALKKVDYLSTVSGGGYIGASMTAAMSKNANDDSDGEFPFKSALLRDEPPGVQHIRDHSNYLFPKGFSDIFKNVAVYLRGLMANVVLLLLPYLLIFAALTIWLKPDSEALAQTNFSITLIVLSVFVGLFVFWALWRSSCCGQNRPDVGLGSCIFGWLLAVILVIGFIELQPFLLKRMLQASHDSRNASLTWANMAIWLKKVAALLASLSAAVGFFGRFLGDALKRVSEKTGFRAGALRIATKLAMYIAGASALAVLWIAYLYLSYWGISDCTPPANCAIHAPSWLVSITPHMPSWLVTVAQCIHFWLVTIVRYVLGHCFLAFCYFIAGLMLLAAAYLLEPNANSLHRLYRDRLSKAFLFNPARRMDPKPGKTDQKSDLLPLDNLKMSDLKWSWAPYHLINAALNVEASQDANQRGRNADFFIFSPLYIGSKATGYVKTEDMEKKVPDLTAAAAMAISGAAASANMGSATIKPLVPALAMLNIRLGYWLPNPNPAKVACTFKALIRRLLDSFYFLNEFLGLLDEKSEKVYLTDGGHIENLGIYELLRRRCQLIIAVDAEADPEMSFGSFITLQRYARIDFGIRIELPWQEVRDAMQKASEQILQSNKTPSSKIAHGPHCALGIIYYPHQKEERDEDRTGLLLYIKSSITGDENDYIMDYKRRHSAFPHETTADQMFSEEQFEVYRALGFHAAQHALDDTDQIAIKPESANLNLLKERLFRILA